MEKLVVTQKQITSIKKSLIDGLTLASGARAGSTYYHSKDEQDKAIKNGVERLYNQSKELPLILANQKGVTGKFIQEVLLNELSKTYKGGACNIVNPIDWYDGNISDKAVLGALYNLNENGIPYVLRLFDSIRKSGVNNERTRKITLGFLWGHSNIEFNALKYRNKIAKALKHVYGVRKTSILISIAESFIDSGGLYNSPHAVNIANDHLLKFYGGDPSVAFKLLLFIFKKDNAEFYDEETFPLISQYYKAKVDITSVSMVPEEVLIGLISNVDHPQYDEMWSTPLKREKTMALLRKKNEVTSVNQQVRQTKSNKKLGVEKSVNLDKATDYLALYKTAYETGFTMKLRNAIDSLAEKNKMKDFPYENIGIVLDTSNSMTGHKQESKNTPRAIAEFTAEVLKKSAKNSVVVETDGQTTDLASSFVKLLRNETEKKYDAIFFLSDGYENAYEGLTNEVVNTWLSETERALPVFQVSPIVSAEMGANVRTLGSEIIKMSITSPKSIMAQINGRLLEVDPKKWLEKQVKYLEESNLSRYKKVEVV